MLTPLTFRLIGDVYRGAFTSLEAEPQALALVRFGLALLALAPATILMGATLPTLTRYLSRDAAHLSSAFGRLYAANTIGAIIGAAAAGLVLIEVLGLTETLVVAACCSGAAGLTAIVIDRRRRAAVPTPVAPVAPPTLEPPAIPDEVADDDPRPRLALVVAFVSGLTSLAYQVLWTRLLASGTGNYTYVFTLILVVFLTGIAIGAVLFTVLRRRIRHPVALLARTNVIVGVLALAGVAFVLSQPVEFTVEAGRIDGLISVLFWRVLVVVLPATIVMGLSFPASSALVGGREGKVATSAGLLLAANTVGAIVGTFVVPFFVIPAIGSPDAIGVIALVNVVLGVVLAYRAPIRSALGRITTYGLGAATAAVLVIALATNGILVDPSVARIEAAEGELFASREDEIASVQAGTVAGYPELWVTGTSMTLLTVDAKLMPILPLMLRPDSKSALTVAFGMGSAFRSGVIAGLRTDAVELVPSVPTMFGYFYPDAAQILASPNGRVVVTDGRNYMELTDQPVRHHRHRPAAADRELGGLGHLLARVLPGRPRPPEPGRDHDAVGAVRPDDRRVPGPRPDVRVGVPACLGAPGPGRLRVLHAGLGPSHGVLRCDRARGPGAARHPRGRSPGPTTLRRRRSTAGPRRSPVSSGWRAGRSPRSRARVPWSPTTGRCPSTSCSVAPSARSRRS